MGTKFVGKGGPKKRMIGWIFLQMILNFLIRKFQKVGMKFISPWAKIAEICWIFTTIFFSSIILLVEMIKWRNKKLEGKWWNKREKKP